tara:strand:- start:83099 stop:83263 length:165 start_codon:yes stop_codon:yes gene_type:complete
LSYKSSEISRILQCNIFTELLIFIGKQYQFSNLGTCFNKLAVKTENYFSDKGGF